LGRCHAGGIAARCLSTTSEILRNPAILFEYNALNRIRFNRSDHIQTGRCE